MHELLYFITQPAHNIFYKIYIMILLVQHRYNFVTLTINLLSERLVIPIPTPARVNVTTEVPGPGFVLSLSAETPPDICVAVLLIITLLALSKKTKLVATGAAETEAVVGPVFAVVVARINQLTA